MAWTCCPVPILCVPRATSSRIAFHARVPDVAEIQVVDVNQGVPQ